MGRVGAGHRHGRMKGQGGAVRRSVVVVAGLLYIYAHPRTRIEV